MEQNNDYIDLSRAYKLLAAYKKRFAVIFGGFVAAALLLALLLPKQYTSTVLVRAKGNSPQNAFSLQAAPMALLMGAANSGIMAYVEIFKSRSVLEPVIAEFVADWPEEEKKRLDNVGFAKSFMEVQIVKGTDLIEVAAKNKSPEEAQATANHILRSFQAVLTKLNQSEQSLMLKFLKERLQTSEREMLQSGGELEDFKQKNKLFVPGEQAMAIIEGMAALDRQIAAKLVSVGVNQAKLREAHNESVILKHNTASAAENEPFQSIYQNLSNKQMQLLDLEQRYTDKHPQVVLARQEIKELREYLKSAIAEVIATDNVELAALRKAKNKVEGDISTLSENGLVYIDLERKARIAVEVHTQLVRSFEQARIQEAMESMDIQVIDEANLPARHSSPQRTLMVVFGALFGIIAGFGYLIYLYYNDSSQTI
jgi:uncharacterized protein involved in exopolysaccharide biosynthesis